jgi:hypothetical protein
MPDPSTLDRSKSRGVTRHSRVQARTCAANASLSSRRSRSFNPSSAPQARHDRRYRSDAHHPPSHSADSPRAKARTRSQPGSGGPLADGPDANRGTVVLARSIAGRDRRIGIIPCQDQSRSSEGLDRRIGPDVLVGVDQDVRFTALERGGNDLVDAQALPWQQPLPAYGSAPRIRPVPRGRSSTPVAASPGSSASPGRRVVPAACR